ncbi:unnamed protein product [Bathycoccus prasinos]
MLPGKSNISVQGEIVEWRQDLRAGDQDLKRNVLKKVISVHDNGERMFPCYLRMFSIACKLENMELKKLVYLYLTNYASAEPDLAILADTQDNNPFIRALAVRTMGCIRVEKITEYLCDPLHLALQDKDPYLVQDRGFLEELNHLLSDNNPIVVANSVAVMAEIYNQASTLKFSLTTDIVSKLLSAMNDCTEWGQVFILDSLSAYSTTSEFESKTIFYPEFLRNDVKVFFCKYNDPAYVKQAKLHMIIQLAHEDNMKEILSEFLEYCTEVDVEFVRKVVRAVGQCAISVSSSAPECVQLLETLIQMKVTYVVQEAIIVLKDIFRQFPNKYEYVYFLAM